MFNPLNFLKRFTKRKKLIYVSGKYTSEKGDLDETRKYIEVATKASIKLFKKGWNVFTPHKNNGEYEFRKDSKDLTYDFWIDIDLDILKRCDAIFMLKNWRNSKGALIEINKAKEWGIKIYFEENGYPDVN
jgi:hypothetical protein